MQLAMRLSEDGDFADMPIEHLLPNTVEPLIYYVSVDQACE
jgi:hypothetical protein